MWHYAFVEFNFFDLFLAHNIRILSIVNSTQIWIDVGKVIWSWKS